jgi:hypothetical protein
MLLLLLLLLLLLPEQRSVLIPAMTASHSLASSKASDVTKNC